MKKLMAVIVLSAFLMPTVNVLADGCYTCKGGGYVKYKGDDTFAKRKDAKENFKCEVSGTSSSCSNAKGTVSDKK